jgi:hypothetical protein
MECVNEPRNLLEQLRQSLARFKAYVLSYDIQLLLVKVGSLLPLEEILNHLWRGLVQPKLLQDLQDLQTNVFGHRGVDGNS